MVLSQIGSMFNIPELYGAFAFPHRFCSVAIQIKAVEQYFAVGRAVCMWFKVVLAVVSVDEIL